MIRTIVVFGTALALVPGPIFAKREAARGVALTGPVSVIDTENWFMQATRHYVAHPKGATQASGATTTEGWLTWQ